MAIVNVPAELPDEIAAKYEAVALRTPRIPGELFFAAGQVLVFCDNERWRLTEYIILRPKIQWPAWFHRRYVFRRPPEAGGVWLSSNDRPMPCDGGWCGVISTVLTVDYDDSWLPDIQWQGSLLENPNWRDA